MREMRKTLITVLAIFTLVSNMFIFTQARVQGAGLPGLSDDGETDPVENDGEDTKSDPDDSDPISDDGSNNKPSSGGGGKPSGGGDSAI